ncbi:hypothetical protein [Planktothricoides raciborskii]|uniref:Uncharacterized protein n=1 Tax=Planktothricoides raciborskii GIHE-MW2 TaxID=2792601 RepID=A0AAU8J8H5_9CYAN|nr:hypothetical protein [Planktothricoides raciborskii]
MQLCRGASLGIQKPGFWLKFAALLHDFSQETPFLWATGGSFFR